LIINHTLKDQEVDGISLLELSQKKKKKKNHLKYVFNIKTIDSF